MSDNLFDIPETLSPRLKWLDKHGVWVFKSQFVDEPQKEIAWTAEACGRSGVGPTADDAIVDLAKRLNLKLWNEEVKP